MSATNAWPRGAPQVGQKAERSRRIDPSYIRVDWRFTAPVRPGYTITGSIRVLEVREDKPITKLATRVCRQDGVVVLEGSAVCYTMAV